MTNRRNFIRAGAVAGGAVVAGIAAGAATAPPARAADPVTDRLSLLSWHAALANRRYEPAVVAVIGSSSTEGVGSAYGRGYVSVLADNLRHAFGVPGAPGGANFVAAWGRPDRWPVLASGGRPAPPEDGWALKGYDLHGGSLTHSFTGTSVQVWYAGGRFQVTVDGQVSAVAGGTTWSSGPLPAGSHTIAVSGVGRINGFVTFDGDENRGIQVWNGGHGGRTTGSFASNVPAWAPRLAAIRPHLVILQLGVNDWRTGVPGPTIKRNLKTVIKAVREHSDPSFVIYGSPRVGPGRAHGFSRLTDAWQEVADEDSEVSYFDLSARQLPPSGDNRLGLYCDDLIHMTDKGAAHTADALTGFLSPG
ncbi:lysophospholipase L1-like esterase [Actinoplanes lutulentus]|uniref:Lysophospholipase L1-like esterase n=1 Tax=Actinoplanes lutulentus TaxID=1287878 RepID=A0A327Z9M9_9ACTN|nr:GDSL-type esterase/lipase family protein [Actinoplanes lutulentus]MBB2948507.1 lysophospholipase L1-like esterase [Actinoplanes lutulentus]RAK34461.1 lysophospholipase L1-like esterase [Actinoplanes lutulentus]